MFEVSLHSWVETQCGPSVRQTPDTSVLPQRLKGHTPVFTMPRNDVPKNERIPSSLKLACFTESSEINQKTEDN